MTKRQTRKLYERLNRCNRRARRSAARALAWIHFFELQYRASAETLAAFARLRPS